ncbi:MAG: hypothetical protein R2851_17745 [Caldilineaceae bacterium]
MLSSLTPDQPNGSNERLVTLSVEQCIGQLLNVSHLPGAAEAWRAFCRRCLRARCRCACHRRRLTGRCWRSCRRSHACACIIANMEHGAEWPDYGTDFLARRPAQPMITSGGSPGKATAREALHIGVHWCLTPAVDPSLT